MKTYEITTVQTVTQEQIDDVLVTAFEGGITYWCDGIKVDKEPTQEYKYFSDVLTRGGTLKVYIRDEDEISVLTLGKLLTALGNTRFDFDDYDAGDADVLIQEALFGEVIYG